MALWGELAFGICMTWGRLGVVSLLCDSGNRNCVGCLPRGHTPWMEVLLSGGRNQFGGAKDT